MKITKPIVSNVSKPLKDGSTRIFSVWWKHEKDKAQHAGPYIERFVELDRFYTLPKTDYPKAKPLYLRDFEVLECEAPRFLVLEGDCKDAVDSFIADALEHFECPLDKSVRPFVEKVCSLVGAL